MASYVSLFKYRLYIKVILKSKERLKTRKCSMRSLLFLNKYKGITCVQKFMPVYY